MQEKSALEQIIARLDSIEARLSVISSEPRGLLPRRAAAAWLGVSLRTLDHLVAAGELPTRLIGGRRLVPLVALREFARRDHPEPTSALRRGRRGEVQQ